MMPRLHPTEWCDASIFGLLASRGPSHVAGLIAAIIVHPIKAVLGRWARPDVRKKGRETILPFLTNGDASAAVPMKQRVARVFASVLHAQPRTIFRRARSLPMNESRLGGTLALDASTTYGGATQKVVPHNNLGLAAFALAIPSRSAARRTFGAADYSQTAELRTLQFAGVHGSSLAPCR